MSSSCIAYSCFCLLTLSLSIFVELNSFKEALKVKKRKVIDPPRQITSTKHPGPPPQSVLDKNRVVAAKPIRLSRRLPRSEKHRPITLPKLGDTLPPRSDDEGRSYKGSEFVARTRVLDTDSVTTRGVATRLIQSMILPKDENGFFGPSKDCMDVAESGALKVNFLIFFVLSILLL